MIGRKGARKPKTWYLQFLDKTHEKIGDDFTFIEVNPRGNTMREGIVREVRQVVEPGLEFRLV